MQIICRVFGQQPSLASWEKQDFGHGVGGGPGPQDSQDVHERQVANEAPGPPEPDGPFRRIASSILGFDIFPPDMVLKYVRREPVDVGDTIGIRYRLTWGVDVFLAARVVARFDELAEPIWRAGFTYRTLYGHPLLGEESFTVEKTIATGEVLVALRSWSRPNSRWARWFYPLVRRWQLQAGQAAMQHLGRMAVG
jgi:hypothetical protein